MSYYLVRSCVIFNVKKQVKGLFLLGGTGDPVNFFKGSRSVCQFPRAPPTLNSHSDSLGQVRRRTSDSIVGQLDRSRVRRMDGWSRLKVPREEVEIATVLACGQSFRWKPLDSDPSGAVIGVFAHKVWILKQTDEDILFKTFPEAGSEDGEEENRILLYNYFQLDVSLKSLYKEWSLKDERFASLTLQDYKGIRILSQDCVENVFSFICSSNNNISRISQMVEKLALFYGSKIATVEGKDYYDFPEVQNLVGEKVERKLREEKFGYRAGYIAKTASKILEKGGVSWLENLRNVGYDEARKELQTLTGIGRKVADCICLMSLGYPEVIPVDTHMHQIAIKYLPHLSKLKSLTEKAYSEITDYFKNLHGKYAGWAHSVLFSSTLKHLKPDGSNNKKRKVIAEVSTETENAEGEDLVKKTNKNGPPSNQVKQTATATTQRKKRTCRSDT